ncbi:hypothetical protein SAMN05444280_103114 [Tangfeifania diversioriginum]|uniref:Virulence protein RhuM family protein n=1 Tax=Tangfeifania diversioriginum TaxID=1168035 RepID=A0A1M6C3D3_9BACT|nr:hypothetical protein [Tangfeifania diversioriginum]SHI55208.1 hypothetical protein SAMN05444280_103114 [Tangfeifania diversioriginum]
MSDSEILLYQTEDGQTRIDVRLKDETGWLSQAQMGELFQPTKLNGSLHIRNIFKEDELNEISVVKESLTAQPEGKREVQRNMKNTLTRIRTEDAQIMKELEEGLKNLENKKQNN